MKKLLFPVGCSLVFMVAASCNSSSTTDTSTDSASNGTATTTTDATSTSGSGSSATSSKVNENTSYVDLSSGSKIHVRRDTSTGYFVNSESNSPLLYYIDPTTSDTFDRQGRVVNNALIKGTQGYSVDESRMTNNIGSGNDNDKVKIQGDGDLKIKSGDTKAKIETDGDLKLKQGDSKEKIKDGNYKSKD